MKFLFPTPSTSSANLSTPEPRFGGYPFELLQLGDYFEVPAKLAAKLATHCSTIQREAGIRMATRTLRDSSVRAMRII